MKPHHFEVKVDAILLISWCIIIILSLHSFSICVVLGFFLCDTPLLGINVPQNLSLIKKRIKGKWSCIVSRGPGVVLAFL